MAFKAVLTIGEDEYKVLDFSYEFKRNIDQRGRPSSETRVGLINATVESVNNNNLASWGMFQMTTKSGKITVYDRDSESSYKVIEFRDAYLYAFQERFNGFDTSPMVISLSISARDFVLNPGGLEFINDWNA